MEKVVTVIGAGLAGCEASWQLAQRGIKVRLYEMRPVRPTRAHKTDGLAELVCSNSFRGADLSNAVGLLKEELKLLNSLIMQVALEAAVPAGGCLAVDRDVFSQLITDKISTHPLITLVREELISIPDASPEQPVIIATGPLTSPDLAKSIEAIVGQTAFAFFDAISPIIYTESMNLDKMFRQSRYEKGAGDEYLNIPFNAEQYYAFIEAVNQAEKYTGHEEVEADSIEKLRPFEGCMPIEDMIARGPETLRFGPFKPKGLIDPKTGKEPYAVLQLRQDNKEATLWNMVGMQTRMKRGDQERIFRSLSGMEQAEFARFGSVHRNSFINSPTCLYPSLEFRNRPGLFFAGQITGVEGYVESTSGGLVAGINAARLLNGLPAVAFPLNTATGGLLHYISDPDRKDFQPMNITWGLIPSYFETEGKKKMPKKERRLLAARQALATLEAFSHSLSEQPKTQNHAGSTL